MWNFLRKHIRSYDGREYAPTPIEKACFGGIVLLVLLTFTATNIQSIALLSSDWLSSSILPAVLIERTNENRVLKHLSGLTRSPLLDAAAERKAKDMAEKGYFAHDSPEGLTPWHWFDEVGYAYIHAGENLAVHFTDSEKVVDAWMASPAHRANILGGQYEEIGIGTARGTYKGATTIFVVQMFGTPMSKDDAALVASVETLEEKKAQKLLASVVVGSVDENVSASLPVVAGEEDTARGFEPELPDAYAPTSTEEMRVEESFLPSKDTTAHSPVITLEIATVSPWASRGVIDLGYEHMTPPQQEREHTFLARILVTPHLVLSIIYLALASLVFCTLIVSPCIEWRRHHPLQVAYATGLIMLMWGAYYVHTALTGSVLIL